VRHPWRRPENNAANPKWTRSDSGSIAVSPLAMLLLYRLVLKESIENIEDVAARTVARTLLPPAPHWVLVRLDARGIWHVHE